MVASPEWPSGIAAITSAAPPAQSGIAAKTTGDATQFLTSGTLG
jgi:hypothetical protein